MIFGRPVDRIEIYCIEQLLMVLCNSNLFINRTHTSIASY